MSETPQRLLIIDDHPLFRKGVLQLIKPEPEFQVVGEASSGPEGLELVASLEPDMILLDLNMRGMDGVEVLKRIKSGPSEARVVMLTVSDQAEDLVAALRAGADGYLLKETEPEILLAKLKEAATGQMILSERLAGLLVRSMHKDAQPREPAEAGLTDQEQRILGLIANGMSNKLIARELDIAESTVKVHVKHLLRKLNLRSRVEAAVWAVERQRGGQRTG